MDLSASGTATADAWRCSRDAPWVTAEVDRDGGMRSSFGCDNFSFSAVGAKGVGGLSRGVPRGWRNEADVDLSDIKATMRRIDGENGDASVNMLCRIALYYIDCSSGLAGAALRMIRDRLP